MSKYETVVSVLVVLAAAVLTGAAIYYGWSEVGAGPLSNNPGYLGRGF